VRKTVSASKLILLFMGLLWISVGLATGQTPDQASPTATEVTEPTQEISDATNLPPYIVELLETSELTPEQADLLRADGLGWGEVRIAVRLAEQIVASSDGTVTFNDALTDVRMARAAGEGFGEIASENDLKVGSLVGNRDRNRNERTEDAAGDPLEAHEGVEAGATRRVTERKQNVFTRLVRFFGFGKRERPNGDLKPADLEKPGKVEKIQKVERVARADRVERPARPEKLERPSKIERPERPARPEKPEKPERGPRR